MGTKPECSHAVSQSTVRTQPADTTVYRQSEKSINEKIQIIKSELDSIVSEKAESSVYKYTRAESSMTQF